VSYAPDQNLLIAEVPSLKPISALLQRIEPRAKPLKVGVLPASFLKQCKITHVNQRQEWLATFMAAVLHG